MDKVKVLLDSCIWSGAKQKLFQANYDVKWVGDFFENCINEMLLKMNTKTKIPIYYVDEENDMEMMVEQAVNATFEENIIRYFQVLAFNCALGGIDITNQPLSRKIYYIDDDPK